MGCASAKHVATVQNGEEAQREKSFQNGDVFGDEYRIKPVEEVKYMKNGAEEEQKVAARNQENLEKSASSNVRLKTNKEVPGLVHQPRAKERLIFRLLVHFPEDHNGQHWVRPQPGAWSSSGSPTWVQEPKHLGHLPLPSQAISRELDQKWRSRDLNWSHIGCWHHRQQLYPLHHSASPGDKHFDVIVGASGIHTLRMKSHQAQGPFLIPESLSSLRAQPSGPASERSDEWWCLGAAPPRAEWTLRPHHVGRGLRWHSWESGGAGAAEPGALSHSAPLTAPRQLCLGQALPATAGLVCTPGRGNHPCLMHGPHAGHQGSAGSPGGHGMRSLQLTGTESTGYHVPRPHWDMGPCPVDLPRSPHPLLSTLPAGQPLTERHRYGFPPLAVSGATSVPETGARLSVPNASGAVSSCWSVPCRVPRLHTCRPPGGIARAPLRPLPSSVSPWPSPTAAHTPSAGWDREGPSRPRPSSVCPRPPLPSSVCPLPSPAAAHTPSAEWDREGPSAAAALTVVSFPACTSQRASRSSSGCWMRRLRRVAITVRKRRTSHSTGHAARTGSSDYCVNRLHPRGNLCRDRFSPANSIIAKETAPCRPPLRLQCPLVDLRGRCSAHSAHRCPASASLLAASSSSSPACSSARPLRRARSPAR